MFAQEHGVLGAAAAGQDGVDPVALGVQRIDDVAGAVGDPLDRRQIGDGEVVQGIGQRQTGDDALEGRIGARRAVAVEIGQNVAVPRHGGGIFHVGGKCRQPVVQQLIDGAAFGLRRGFGLDAAGMRPDDVIDQRAGCRLSALVQP